MRREIARLEEHIDLSQMGLHLPQIALGSVRVAVFYFRFAVFYLLKSTFHTFDCLWSLVKYGQSKLNSVNRKK